MQVGRFGFGRGVRFSMLPRRPRPASFAFLRLPLPEPDGDPEPDEREERGRLDDRAAHPSVRQDHHSPRCFAITIRWASGMHARARLKSGTGLRFERGSASKP